MPIRHTVYHPDRLIVGVASGDTTLMEFAKFTREIERAGLLHYRKIIDVANSRPVFSQQELRALAQFVRETRCERKRGALAIVADPQRSEFARIFSGIDIDKRPAKVFTSIHDARKWISENTPPDE